MNIAERALWLIESRLADKDPLAALAGEVGVSPYALLRAFSVRFGITPMAYARHRRLGLAAQAVQTGRAPLLEIALDAGYESHEAFSRAFKDAFGLTPDAARKSPRTALAIATPPILGGAAQRPPHSPARIEHFDAPRLIGLRRAYAADEAGAIPAQWGAFAGIAAAHAAADAPRLTFGVLDAQTSDTPTNACAAPATAFAQAPPDFAPIAVPSGRYAVVSSPAHVARIRDVWAEAWSSAAVHALGAVVEGPEIERYGPAFNPRTGEGGFDVMIPIA
jgi:AraC family transcriptional regulator